MSGEKVDGGGLGLSELNELADSFKTISEIFAKLAREEKKALGEAGGVPVTAQRKYK